MGTDRSGNQTEPTAKVSITDSFKVEKSDLFKGWMAYMGLIGEGRSPIEAIRILQDDIPQKVINAFICFGIESLTMSMKDISNGE